MGSNGYHSGPPPVTCDDLDTAWACIHEMNTKPQLIRNRSDEDLALAAQALSKIIQAFQRIGDIATLRE